MRLNDHISIKGLKRFVSRGGEKLEGAIYDLKLEKAFDQQRIIDIGASTGGFVDCLLKHGAKQVFAVDMHQSTGLVFTARSTRCGYGANRCTQCHGH